MFRKTYIFFLSSSPPLLPPFGSSGFISIFSAVIGERRARTAVKTGNEPPFPVCSVSRHRVGLLHPRPPSYREAIMNLWRPHGTFSGCYRTFLKYHRIYGGTRFLPVVQGPACVPLVSRCAFDVHIDRYHREGNAYGLVYVYSYSVGIARPAIINLRERLHVDF